MSLVAARFADLLWIRRYGDRPHEWAQKAIDAYVGAAEHETFWHPVETSEGAQRAYELAVSIADSGRQSAVTAVLLLLVRRSLDQGDSPGVSLSILERLSRRRPADRSAELIALVDEAVRRHIHDPWQLESALDIKATLVPVEDRSALRVQQVEAFAQLARSSQGLVKYGHFQRAIELAAKHGLRELADELRCEVEAITEDELGLNIVSTTISVPHDQIEQYVQEIVGDDDLLLALGRFGARLPTGSPDRNRAFVQQMMAAHPVQFAVTRMTIGPDNALIRATVDEADHEAQALTRHEAMQLQVFGPLAVDILARMGQRYGSLGPVASRFESELIEPVVAERIAHAISLFQEQDYDSSACLLVPRIERIIRSIAQATGLSITSSPEPGGRPGGVKMLGTLLDGLKQSLSEAAYRYLRALLTEATGLNLRNRISHGVVDHASAWEAALLIHAACHLRLYRVVVAPSEPAECDSPETQDR